MAGLNITEEEAREYEGLPKEVVASRYIRAHHGEKCPHCGRFVGNHSTKQLLNCINTDELKYQVERFEPEEVPMIQCPFCGEWVPPAFACIKCFKSLRQPDIKIP